MQAFRDIHAEESTAFPVQYRRGLIDYASSVDYSQSLSDKSGSSCPPANLAPMQDFDLANFVSAPWYAQAMVRFSQ
jgi:hypothetical protein